MQTSPFAIVILAAGKGSRMGGELPKALCRIAGKPILERLIENLQSLDAAEIFVVVGYKAEAIIQQLCSQVTWVRQHELNGTAGALACCLPKIQQYSRVMVINGDTVLLDTTDLQSLILNTPVESVGLLIAEVADPYGYGRIVTDDDQGVKIIEEADLCAAECQIKQINTGVYMFPVPLLQQHLNSINANKITKELYLSFLPQLASENGYRVLLQQMHNFNSFMGVNTQQQRSNAERAWQLKQANNLLAQGVYLADPHRVDIRGTLLVGDNVSIDVNVIFIGDVKLGNGVSIGANAIIEDSNIGDNCDIKPNSIITSSNLQAGCIIGPFAHIRPNCDFAENVKIGNFTEVKNAEIKQGVKANHLSYLGDCVIGSATNIGAGTITCNYDGKDKHKTVIGRDVFIGSNSCLIAPIKLGDGSMLAAGTVLTKDLADNLLVVQKKAQTELARETN